MSTKDETDREVKRLEKIWGLTSPREGKDEKYPEYDDDVAWNFIPFKLTPLWFWQDS